AILYEMLTGRPPFRGATPLETIDLARTLDPVSPHQLRAGVPRDLEVVCLKCLAKAPAQRYASAAALADDLARFRRGRPILARPAGRLERLLKWARRRPGPAAVVGVGALAAAALVVGAWVYESRLRDALGEARGGREQAREQGRRADEHYK